MNSFTKLAVIICVLVLLLPVFYMLASSFGGIDIPFITEVISNNRHWILLGNTAFIAFFTTLASMLIGVTIAVIISRFKIPLARTMEYLLILPILIPSYFMAISWVYLIGVNGLITNYLKNIFETPWMPFSIYGKLGAVFILTLSYFPLVALMTLSGLRNIDFSLEKTAWLTASRWRAFFRVTLPLVMPYIIGSGILVFILAVNNFDVPAILLTDVFPLEIFYQFSVFFRTDRAMMFALPLAAASIGAILLWYAVFKRRPLFTVGTGWKQPAKIELGTLAKLVASGFIVLMLIMAVFLPLAGLISNLDSFNTIITTLQLVSDQLLNSLTAAAIATLAALAIGITAAYIMEQPGSKIKWFLIILMALPLVMPGSALGIGLIKMYNTGALMFIYKSIWIIILGLTARYMIIPTLILNSSVKMIDPSLENAARVSGAPWHRIWLKIMIPLNKKAIIISTIIYFILALNELSVTILVAPPGFNTLSIRIYSLYHFNKNAEVSAMCLIMAFIVILLYAVLASVIFKDKNE